MPLTRIKTTAIDHVFLSEFLGTVASESAMLALVGGIGDYAVRSDLNNDSFIITQNNGSSIGDWQKISNTSTALLKSENLNDLPSAATARTNLGLGTAATTAATNYATAAQGTKADTALQPTNNLSDLSNSGTALDNLGFSTFGKTIIDDADAAAVRTTLGLGEAATADTLGGAQDFVATGSISSGDIVGLRSDGTVEVVTGTGSVWTTSAGTPVVWESGAVQNVRATFDSNSNKIVIVYTDYGNSNYGTAVVGTVSGTSISFGSPVVFNSDNSNIHSATFDSNTNKVVIAYFDLNLMNGYARVGTVSGTSISFGTPVVFHSGVVNFTSLTFDSNTNKVVFAYRDPINSGYGTARVGTVSGTSISFGTPVVFYNGSTNCTSATFDSNTNKVVLGCNNVAVVGTVSGTNISFGSPVSFAGSGTYMSATFDSNTNKVIIALNSTAVVGTVSGTSISFGSPVSFASSATYISATFDPILNRVVIAYKDGNNSDYGTAVAGTLSGDTISFGTPNVFESAVTQYISAIFDSNTNQVVIVYEDYDNSRYGTARVFQLEGNNIVTNADTWIGIAAENISDTASGSINILSGVAEGLTGLTAGATYYVSYDGTLTTTENAGLPNGTYGKIGRALSSTQLLITSANE